MAEPTDVGGAVTALDEILGKGPIGATSVANLMRSRGFGRDATRGAKQRLRVVVTKTGMAGGWEWSLPSPEESGPVREASEASEESGADSSSDSSDSSSSRARARTPLEPDSSDPSDSSKSRKSRVPGWPPAPAGAHAREALSSEVVTGCRDYRAHQLTHYYRPDGWHCPRCEEEDVEA
jgi:hypothetical protein